MQCRNCSGNEFKKTESGNYRCAYCSTLFYEEKLQSSGKPGFSLRSSIAFFIGAVLIISVSFTTVFFYQSRNKSSAVNSSSSTANGATFSAENFPDPEGKVLSVDVIPDLIGNHYFLAVCQNTGKVAINAPHVIVRLFSGDRKVGSGSGYAFMSDLNPGEITPVLILIQKPPAYTRFESEYKAEKPFIIPENGVFEKRFSAELSDVILKPGDIGNLYRLRGRIKNTGIYGAKFVQVAAILYDRGGKVIGYDSTFINEKLLKPGDFDLFEMNIIRLCGKPERYRLFYYGTVE